MNCTLPSQDAWRRARDHYIKDLTDDEKHRYDNASPENILYDTSASQKVHETHSRGRKVLDSLRPLISAIEQYTGALDVYSNAYPLVLSPLWGSIRVVLHLAREFNKYFDKIIDMFSRIGDVLPRFEVFQRLFRNHERVIQALSVAYIDIITFCSSAKDVFRQGQRTSKTTFKVAFKLIWKPFERQFEQQMASFRLHLKNVEKEAGIAHMVESADSRALVLANQMQISKDKRLHDRIRIMALFPAIDYEAKHRQLVDLRHEGTGKWLLEHTSYVAWKSKQQSGILCLYGIPGCGKSVLASAIIDDLAISARPGAVDTFYFYCEYADQATLRSTNLFGSILRQCYTYRDIPDGIQEQILRAYGHGARSPSTSELINILTELFTLRSRVIIVLDGLDECEKEAWREIVRCLESLVAGKSTVIQFLVTCVEESEILRVLHLQPRIHASSSALAGDIESFVASSVQSRIECGDLNFHDPGLQREIIHELTSKANGMFLWVYFQLNELCEAISDAMIREILESLPDGLTNTYTRLLSKMGQGSRKTQLIQKLFKWIACARRPLRADEIMEAVAIEASDTSIDSTKIPDEVLLVESCKGLVVRDPRDRTVRFAHHTIQQHLLSEMSNKGAEYFHFRWDEANAWIGTICISYLYFSEFETQVTKRPPKRKLQPKGLFDSEGPLGIPSILGLNNSWLQIPYRLLGGKPAMNGKEIDYTEHLAGLRGSSTNSVVDMGEKYKLLDYVISYWEPHTRDSMMNDYEKKTQDLAMYKELPFAFRPWGENEHFGPYGCSACPTEAHSQKNTTLLPHVSLFNYATQVGNMMLLRPLFKEYHEHEGFETFLLACRHGQLVVLRYFMDHIPDEIPERRAFEAAADSGHLHILQYLLHLSIHPGYYLGRSSYLAAKSGHDHVVAYLRDKGFNMNAKDEFTGWGALEVAAHHGHDSVVRALLMARFDIERQEPWDRATDEHYELHSLQATSALSLAAENGHAAVVRSLFELSTPDQTKIGPIGYTPLHYAAQKGHVAVVDALLENCSRVDKIALLEMRSHNLENNLEIPAIATASYYAARNGHIHVLEVLQRHGLSFQRSGDDLTEIEAAAVNGHEEVIHWLIHHGADVNAGSAFGRETPLSLAMKGNHEPAMSALLECGADYQFAN